MKIKRIVKPGQPGTKRLTQQYGDNLICVRYRYDAENQRMLKTIELIVENEPWQPNKEIIPKHKIINLRIAANEGKLQDRVKRAGARWDPANKVWRLTYRKVLELKLEDRIIG